MLIHSLLVYYNRYGTVKEDRNTDLFEERIWKLFYYSVVTGYQ